MVSDYLSFVRSAIENISSGFYDSFVEDNARAAGLSGAKSVITRKSIGRCCDWCDSLIGTWDYWAGEYPEDVFRRHQNCTCIVTVSTGKGHYQDVWTKKSYESERDLVIERVQAIEAEMIGDSTYARLRLAARERGEKFIDATKYYQRKRSHYISRVRKVSGNFTINGKTYNTGDRGVTFSKMSKEWDFAKEWVKANGGRIELVPRVTSPQGVPTPDFILDGMQIDLKQPDGGGRWVISHQADALKGQADRMIIDLSNSGLLNRPEELQRQIRKVFNDDKYPWLNQIIISDGTKIKYVADRI